MGLDAPYPTRGRHVRAYAAPPPDKREARANAAASKAYAKSQRNWFARHKILSGLGAFIALIAIIGVANSGKNTDRSTNTTASSDTKPSTPPAEKSKAPAAPKLSDAAKDVSVTDCEVQDLAGTKFAKVNYTINNNTSKSSTYLMQFAVVDSTGAGVSQAMGIEPNVLPGRPSKGQASGNVSQSAVGPYKCEVSSVTRTAS